MKTNPIVAVKPIKVSVTRIQAQFENVNPYKYSTSGVIKDYVYTDQKRFIA